MEWLKDKTDNTLVVQQVLETLQLYVCTNVSVESAAPGFSGRT